MLAIIIITIIFIALVVYFKLNEINQNISNLNNFINTKRNDLTTTSLFNLFKSPTEVVDDIIVVDVVDNNNIVDNFHGKKITINSNDKNEFRSVGDELTFPEKWSVTEKSSIFPIEKSSIFPKNNGDFSMWLIKDITNNKYIIPENTIKIDKDTVYRFINKRKNKTLTFYKKNDL